MRSEVVFVVGYAVALLAGAVGLQRLGRTSREHQPGRLRGGPIRVTAERTSTVGADPDWPRSEVPHFYSAMALVASGASMILPVAELVGRDPRPSETALLISVVVLAVLTLSRIGRRLDLTSPRRTRRRRDDDLPRYPS